MLTERLAGIALHGDGEASSRDPQHGSGSLPFGWAGQTAIIAAHRGMPIFDILAGAGIGGPRGIIDDQTAVSAAQYALIGVGIINLVGDEMHAVSRTRMQRGTVSTGLKIMASARTFRAAIESLAKFYSLMGQAEKIDLVVSGGVARVELTAGIDDKRVAAVIEEMMAVSLHCQFGFVLGRSLSLLALVTPGDHPNSNLGHPYLDCRIVRGTTTALLFSASYLDLEPSAKISDTPITDCVFDWLDRIGNPASAGVDRDSLKPLSAAVFDKLRELDISYAECCQQMGMQGDELRRALFAEGSGYRLLRHSALIDRLRPHLAAGENMDDVAMALGYSDARSLRRSVRSASGMSLTELRQNINRARPSYDPLVIGRLKHQLDAME